MILSVVTATAAITEFPATDRFSARMVADEYDMEDSDTRRLSPLASECGNDSVNFSGS
jgi:hypothetical protein